MRHLNKFTLLTILGFLSVCAAPESLDEKLKAEYPEMVKITIENKSSIAREEALVVLSPEKIRQKAPDFNAKAFIVVAEGKEIASQPTNGKTAGDILFVSSFDAREKKTITLRYAKMGERHREYVKRSQAELSHRVGGKFINRKYDGGNFQNVDYLRVPPEHTDHSMFIRYEGPGWESDKVGYRFYLDWRNAIDIFGKRVPDMVLQNVGQDGFDSYHNLSDWGMDVFKVGNSLGLGSIAMWHGDRAIRVEKTDSVTCEIVENGVLFSQIRTRYFGWEVGQNKFNLQSDISIAAGSRMSRNDLVIRGEAENLCTGLAKFENTIYSQKLPQSAGTWGYMALWGKQSLLSETDELGIAVIFPGAQFVTMAEDDLNHVVILKPVQGMMSYYFLAAWDLEPDGIQTQEAFIDYLDQTILGLNSPLGIRY